MATYFTIEIAPGKQYFQCEKQRATLSTEACGGMWREANHQRLENRITCRGCALGAEHAGEAQASLSVLRGAPICARCHVGSMRLIHGHLCVSCYNRQREWVIGKNAKGKMPIKIGHLERRKIFFMSGSVPNTLSMPRTSDSQELLIAALRDSSERVRFAYRGSPRLIQKTLWSCA